jgi:hypothetical protein
MSDLAQYQMSTLARFHIEHYNLNHYLQCSNITDNANCSCGRGIETIKHYLLDCINHKEAWKRLQQRVGWWNMRVHAVLGKTSTW